MPLTKKKKNINKNKNKKSFFFKENRNNDSKICSPMGEDSFTCFSKKGLINIIESWNKYYANDKIDFNGKHTKLSLWNKVDSKLNKTCNTEYCWTEQKFITNPVSIKKKFFKPLMPKHWENNINEWLSTLDIENVMKQYKYKYSNFHFIGPVPIDFDSELDPGYCVVNELCKIRINNLLKNGYTKLGIIFNLDKHNETGSHWVSLFADFDTNNIYYFDSYGVKEPKEIADLMDRLKKQGLKIKREIKLHKNKIRHQFKGSECGIYSIHFIIKLLENNKYEDIVKNIIRDDEMQENRNVYYIKKKELE